MMDNDWSDYLKQHRAERNDVRDSVDALENGAVAMPLTQLGLLRVRGEDAQTFLHNLLSNDVDKLQRNRAQWSSFNTPKGRMLSSFLLWRHQEDWLLTLSRDISETLRKKLSFYVLRSRVELSDASDGIALIGIAGPQTEHCLQTADLPPPGEGRLEISAMKDGQLLRIDEGCCLIAINVAEAIGVHRRLLESGCADSSENLWNLAMIRRGLPLLSAATQEMFVAQMLNFDAIGGIRSGRGCYPGQEIITRVRTQGKVKQHLYRLSLQTSAPPPAGTALFAPQQNEQAVGTIVNAASTGDKGCEALAVVRDDSVGDELRMDAPDGARAQRLDLPYGFGLE